MNLSENQKFEALKLRYTDQVEVLRHMKQNEFRLVFGFLTLQLILCAFVLKAENPIGITQVVAIGALDSFAGIALTVMFCDYKKRRTEVVDTIRSIMTVFEFYTEGAYAEKITINPPTPKMTDWSNWYRAIALLSLLATLIVAGASISEQRHSRDAAIAPPVMATFAEKMRNPMLDMRNPGGYNKP